MDAFYFFPHTHITTVITRLPTAIFSDHRSLGSLINSGSRRRKTSVKTSALVCRTLYYVTVVLSCKIRTLLPSVCFLLYVSGLTVMSVHSTCIMCVVFSIVWFNWEIESTGGKMRGFFFAFCGGKLSVFFRFCIESADRFSKCGNKMKIIMWVVNFQKTQSEYRIFSCLFKGEKIVS